MPQNVLIAALGEHPAVVTGMVKALREIAGIKIDILCVLYSQDTGRKYIDGIGTGQIEDFLRGQCEVHSVPLPFSDPNTRETSIQFLQALAGLLEQYRDAAQHVVYLSLAGGRKNTSALMALVTQFFPAVQGLYHLLDKREGQPGAAFPTIEEMMTMTEAKKLAVLDPPLEQLNLIPVPYPGAFADSVALWQYLKTDPAHWDNLLPVALTPEAEDFFRQVAGSKLPEPRLQVKITSQAMQDYEKLGAELQGKFIGYAQRMQYPLHLEAKMSGPRGWETDCEVYPEHKAHSNLRLLYYWDRGAQTVTIVRVMLHDEYDRGGEMWRDNSCESNPISALKREYLLLVPLGQSPMVVTQTYTLLRESAAEGRPQIPLVAVIYPEQHGSIGEGMRLLKQQFQLKKVDFLAYPIRGRRDVDSEDACKAYLDTLLAAIEDLQQKHPDRHIALSLSGGRKGMSALTLFAAQWAGIEQVYHTLITDEELERRVEDETTLKVLNALPTDAARSRQLFLDDYDKSRFELFRIPVISVQRAK